MMDKKIKECLKQIFPKKKFKVLKKLGLGSFKEWDSLAHLNFMLIIEKKFKIKFTMNQMYEVKKITEIKKIINSKK